MHTFDFELVSLYDYYHREHNPPKPTGNLLWFNEKENMCRHFSQNRAKLVRLIYGQKTPFNADEIVSLFEAMQSGDTTIDGSQTIADFLEELTELGALIFEDGRYRNKKEEVVIFKSGPPNREQRAVRRGIQKTVAAFESSRDANQLVGGPGRRRRLPANTEFGLYPKVKVTFDRSKMKLP